MYRLNYGDIGTNAVPGDRASRVQSKCFRGSSAVLFSDRTQTMKRVPISTEQFERHAHASDHYTALGCNSPRQMSPSARNINIQLLWFVNGVSLGLQLWEFRRIVVSSFSGSRSVSFSRLLDPEALRSYETSGTVNQTRQCNISRLGRKIPLGTSNLAI
jgi:hypothetical protein